MLAKSWIALVMVILALPSLASAASPTPTDYSNSDNWMVLPSEPLAHNVDVFYVYPTAYAMADGGPIICPVNDPGMRQGARVAYSRQATAFQGSANIYAPFYRQADAQYTLSLCPKQQDKVISGAPGTDVKAAFKYFIKHYNQNRPFILASHSQGSAALKYLLSGYMKAHPRVLKRMIVAYIVGQSITRGYLAKNPHLKFAKGPNDTGVIVSWNTEAEAIAAKNPVTLRGGIAINPITWTRKPTEVSAAQNLGSIALDPATGGTPVLNEDGSIKRVMGLADARVDKKKGVVICSAVNPADYQFGFPEGVYHTFDYPFYFFDIQANAANRISHFFMKHERTK